MWDDAYWLVDSWVTPRSDGLVRAWTSGDRYDFLPLTSSAFWLEWRLFGADATGYRVVNAVLHGFAAALVYLLFRRLPLRGGFVAAALFAAHPVAVSSVAWITELKNTLSGGLFFGSLLAFVALEDSRRSRALISGGSVPGLSLLLFALAILAKASVVVLPGILLTLLAWKRGGARKLQKADLVRVAPFLALAVAGALFAAHVQSTRAVGAADVRPEGFLSTLAAAGMSIAFYMGKAIAPIQLSVIYPRWEVSASNPAAYVSLIAVVASLGALLFASRSNPPFTVGNETPSPWKGAALAWFSLLLCFIVSLIPVLGLVDLAWFRFSFVADHWAYLALPFALALIVDLGARALDTATRGNRVVLQGAAALAILVCAVLGASRSRAYLNEGTLWTDTLAKNPAAYSAHNSLGMWLAGGGQREEAREHFREAALLRPTYSYPVYNLALTYAEEGDFATAKEHLQKALEIAPEYPDALATLGSILVTEGAIEEGIPSLEHALRLEEQNPEAHVSLAVAYLALSRSEDAVRHLERAREIAPHFADAHYHLARAKVQLGDLPGAAACLEEVVRLAPEHPDAGRVLEAIRQALAASNPGNEGSDPAAPGAGPGPGQLEDATP